MKNRFICFSSAPPLLRMTLIRNRTRLRHIEICCRYLNALGRCRRNAGPTAARILCLSRSALKDCVNGLCGGCYVRCGEMHALAWITLDGSVPCAVGIKVQMKWSTETISPFEQTTKFGVEWEKTRKDKKRGKTHTEFRKIVLGRRWGEAIGYAALVCLFAGSQTLVNTRVFFSHIVGAVNSREKNSNESKW